MQVFFLKLLPKFCDFVCSNDCIRKITSKSIRLYPVFILKNDLKVIKKGIIFCEKMRVLGYHIQDYTHSFFGFLIQCAILVVWCWAGNKQIMHPSNKILQIADEIVIFMTDQVYRVQSNELFKIKFKSFLLSVQYNIYMYS